MKNSNIIHNIKFSKPNIQKDIVVYEGHYNNFNHGKHVHEDYTISVIQKGNMSAFLRGFNYKFDKSSIITINPDEIHSCGIIDQKEYKHRSIYIKPQTIIDILKENFSKKQLSFSNSHFNNDFLYNKLSFLTNEDNISLINKLSWECELIDIINHILKINSKANEIIELPAHKILIKKIKDYFNDNFFMQITLDDIVKEFNISKYHFVRLFKKHTFVSPHTYLMLVRVEKAKSFLQNGFSLTETAYMCGFNDQSHLNKRFKTITGLTPGEYKKFFT
ncbi:AraC family transcriptional regulator [Malaciobacter molluscorum LMG 25693]|uniref:AraC family transcriptional regulator n=1 Tax=Malaciobacter molluscorum LMG 25693 TaxID=870501 RepID=A0A2G1DEZ5_9BACT|nr:AraC family transcriptional regulator [Malaciobacter molluscorum]AXX91255.1 transcriptional regulator, AraC family [Malaciobacter molluscorum LMG 25693]PHO17068.1 AraC family transcriptional regulator [Malaciobacter molluscorum LMG 25693]